MTFDGWNYKVMPEMLFERRNPGCTLFRSAKHGGRNVVLAVAGDGLNTAEIFDYTNNGATKWEQSNALSFYRSQNVLCQSKFYKSDQ